jgi:acetolactate decarboxylase
MANEISNVGGSTIRNKSWCVEWLGSKGDFLAEGNRQPIGLERLYGLENLDAIGSLIQRTGAVSIFDSVPLITEVARQSDVAKQRSYCAESLVYAIAEQWCRTTIRKAIKTEADFETMLLPAAVIEGINVDEPFPFLLYGHVAQATCRVCCDLDPKRQDTHSEPAPQAHFSIENEPIELVGFYSNSHPGTLTPQHSHFHMHLRTMDNRLTGHLESVHWDYGVMVHLPGNER